MCSSDLNRTTALWSIWMVASLILAGLGLVLVSHKRVVPKSSNPAAHTDQDTVLSKYLFGLNGLSAGKISMVRVRMMRVGVV